MALPSDDARRKQIRAFMGFVKYFPDAIALVAYLSKVANDQHNPGEPMHWAKDKSKEELDSLMNHLMDVASKGELSQDSDGILDAIKIAWRGMANLQRLVDKHGLDRLFELMDGKAVDDDYELEIDYFAYPFHQDPVAPNVWRDRNGRIVPPHIVAATEKGQ